MFFIFCFHFLLLIEKFTSKEIKLKKTSNDNNEYNPYVFNFTLNDDNNNTLIKYPSIFDTTQLHILVKDENLMDNISEIQENIIIKNTTFYYYKTNYNKNLILNNGYYGIIGLSNKTKDEKFSYSNTSLYLQIIEKEEEDNKNFKKYVNFIQNENEASMIFGSIDSIFEKSNPRTCKCVNAYWSCKINYLKIGSNKIDISTSQHGIFSISEENILAPKAGGDKIIDYYNNKIKELFGIVCNKTGKQIVYMRCDYFNYEDLPDLSFVMESGFSIMALSIDLFKILKNFTLEFKIKYKNDSEDSNIWYLGEPVVKNYNFLLNYTDKSNVKLLIIPSSLNGFILIIVACVGGFLFLFIFLTIIYCVSKNDKKFAKRKSYFSNWNLGLRNTNNSFISHRNTYIKEKVEENSDEDEKSESSESKSESKSDDKSDSESSGSNDSEKRNVEEKKLDDDEENIIENNENIQNINIQENNINNNLILNTSVIDTKDKFYINPKNKINPVHVELSINNYDDEDNDENNELIGKK